MRPEFSEWATAAAEAMGYRYAVPNPAGTGWDVYDECGRLISEGAKLEHALTVMKRGW